MRRHCFTGFCCLLLFSSSVYAQQKTATTPALGPNLGTVRQSRCQQALTTPLPAESNEPAYAPGSSHAKINSISLYYRLNDQQRDYTRARHLAWGERNAYATHPGGSPIFTGPLVLAMIYANGLDTPRNPALALRMACEATAYPNNLGPEELDRLQSILDSKSIPPPPFEVCTPQPNDVGTKELCYTLAYAQQNQRWSDQVDVLAQSWPADQKAALANLKPAAFEFFRTSSIYEWQAITPGASLGSNGALPPDWYKPANKLLQDNFLSAMQGLETGHPPITTKLTSAQADAQLNTQYRSFDDRLRVDFNGSTTVLSVPSERNIQRLWLAYRDAFLALIRLRRPQLTAQWNAQLTADRTQTLIKLIDLLSSIDHPSAQPWLATCAHYRSTPLPPEFHDIDESAAKEAPSCFAYKSYYGLGTPVDFAKARTCAIQERVQYGYYHDIGIDQSDPSSPVGTEINGPVILTMIYANGDGTSRSIPLALRFACEAVDNRQVGSPEVFSNEEENQTIVPDLLNAIQQTSRTGKPLDMCEHVPGLARMQTVCDLIGQVSEQQTRDHDIATLAANLHPRAAHRLPPPRRHPPRLLQRARRTGDRRHGPLSIQRRLGRHSHRKRASLHRRHTPLRSRSSSLVHCSPVRRNRSRSQRRLPASHHRLQRQPRSAIGKPRAQHRRRAHTHHPARHRAPLAQLPRRMGRLRLLLLSCGVVRLCGRGGCAATDLRQHGVNG